MEKVSGQSLGDYLKHHFFDPIGMKNTGVHKSEQIRKNEATGYSYTEGRPKKSTNWDMSRAGGAGNLYSTTQDLYRWNQVFFKHKILKPETVKSALTPVKLNDGSQGNAIGGQYGYGWMLTEERGLKKVGHSGGLPGWSAYLTCYPEQNLTIAILANALLLAPSLEPSDLADRIAEIYLWQQMKPVESYATDQSVNISDDYLSQYDYLGQYDYTGGIMTITQERDQLFAQLTGQPRFEIFPKSETKFFWKIVNARVRFVKNEKGEVSKAIHFQANTEIQAPKIE